MVFTQPLRAKLARSGLIFLSSLVFCLFSESCSFMIPISFVFYNDYIRFRCKGLAAGSVFCVSEGLELSGAGHMTERAVLP